MHYTSLRLKQFRSYSDYSVEFSPSVNIVVGPNASGKTNLLEAVLVASSGSSFRAKDLDLIQFDKPWARIEALSNDDTERLVTIKTVETGSEKKLTVNQKEFKRLPVASVVPTTLFEPEHLRMIHGSPESRRDYIDTILMSTKTGYKTTLRKYKRALAQRNRLLKTEGRLLADQLFVWDVQISEYGALLAKARREVIDIINKQSNQLYTSVSGKKNSLQLLYQTNIKGDYASALLKGLQGRHKDDQLRGFTTLGPHRDDIVFQLGGHNAAQSASRGEARTIVLVCKLIELLIAEDHHERPPILLLDDVFSELDSARRRALTEYLTRYQTIITTTDADAILQHFVGDYNVIPTERG